MNGQRQQFALNSPGPRGAGTAVILTLLFIGAWYMRHALDYIVMAALTLWLLLVLGRHARHDTRGDNDKQQVAGLKLALLRARLVAMEIAAALKDPDMAQAARDRAAGRITQEDYETALELAAEEAAKDRAARRASRFRFR